MKKGIWNGGSDKSKHSLPDHFNLDETKCALSKLALIMDGKLVMCSHEELQAIAPFDTGNIIRSRPRVGSESIGSLSCWECWIEHRDLVRILATA